MRHLDGKTILVIDDEIDLQKVLCYELESQGAKVFCAQNGVEGLKIVQDKNIDLVVSDIQMDKGNGIDFLKNVKKKDPFSPVVFLMTGYSEVSMEDLYELGASGIFSKPFALGDLISLSSRFLLSYEVKWYQSSDITNATDINIELDDISKYLGQGGIFLTIKTAFPLHQELSFNITSQTGPIKKLRGLGRVLWSKKNQGLGLEFASLENNDLEYLVDFIKKNRPTSYIPTQKKLD